jgi:hypothetical protein
MKILNYIACNLNLFEIQFKKINLIQLHWNQLKRNEMHAYWEKRHWKTIHENGVRKTKSKKTLCRVFLVDKGFCRFYIEIVQVATYNLWNLKLSYINQLWWIIIMWIFKKGGNVKACYEFGNEPMKMCFEHKLEWRL